MSSSRSPKRHREYKRKHSRSHSRDRYKKKNNDRSPSTSVNFETDFSFWNYKRELNKIILYSSESNTIANNLDDFWVFLKKYEVTLRKAGKPILNFPRDNASFSKFDCIIFKTKMKFMDTVCDDTNRTKLDSNMFESFLNIISVYIDFKNREKFMKLKKLRQAQNDLPVAKYRYLIYLCIYY